MGSPPTGRIQPLLRNAKVDPDGYPLTHILTPACGSHEFAEASERARLREELPHMVTGFFMGFLESLAPVAVALNPSEEFLDQLGEAKAAPSAPPLGLPEDHPTLPGYPRELEAAA